MRNRDTEAQSLLTEWYHSDEVMNEIAPTAANTVLMKKPGGGRTPTHLPDTIMFDDEVELDGSADPEAVDVYVDEMTPYTDDAVPAAIADKLGRDVSDRLDPSQHSYLTRSAVSALDRHRDPEAEGDDSYDHWEVDMHGRPFESLSLKKALLNK